MGHSLVHTELIVPAYLSLAVLAVHFKALSVAAKALSRDLINCREVLYVGLSESAMALSVERPVEMWAHCNNFVRL